MGVWEEGKDLAKKGLDVVTDLGAAPVKFLYNNWNNPTVDTITNLGAAGLKAGIQGGQAAIEEGQQIYNDYAGSPNESIEDMADRYARNFKRGQSIKQGAEYLATAPLTFAAETYKNPWDTITSLGAAGAKASPELVDIGKRYIEGAKQSYEEMARTQRQLDEVSDYDGATGKRVPKQGYTQNDVDYAQSQASSAAKTFRQDAVYSVLLPAGIPEGIYDSAKEGGILKVGRDVTYGPVADLYNDPDLKKKMEENPVATMTNVALTGAQLVAPLGFAKYIRSRVMKDVKVSPEYAAKIDQYGQENHPDKYNVQPEPQKTTFTSTGDTNLDGYIQEAAAETGLNPNLLKALIDQESSFNPNAESPVGAKGYAQLMPDTARGLGVDASDPRQNVLGGARYLKEQLDKFDGDIDKALAAYNAGPGAVEKYGGVPPYKETQDYVRSIKEKIGNEEAETPISEEKVSPEENIPVEEENTPSATEGREEDYNPIGVDRTNDYQDVVAASLDKPRWNNSEKDKMQFNQDESVLDKPPVNVTSLRGDEIPLSNDFKQARKETHLWARENIRGEYVNDDTGWNISVSRKGIDESANHAKDIDHLKALVALPDLIKNSVKIDSRKHLPVSDQIKAVHTFYAPLEIGDKPYISKIVVKESDRGKLFYDHQASKIERPSVVSSGPERINSPSATSSARSSTMNIRDLMQYVKEEHKIPSMRVKRISESEMPEGTPGLNSGEQGALPFKRTSTSNGNVEPVTRMEINKSVNDLVASRTGLVGNKNYAGVFKVDKDVIRSRNFGDFDVQAHEVGHYLDKQLKVSGHDAELIAAADKIWSKNKIYDKYTPAERRAEGIAEFSRQYLTDPAKAKQNFPGYYKDFTDKLSQDKKLSAKVSDIGDKMQRWFNQSSEARGRGGVTFGHENYTSLKEKATNAAYSAYEKFFDDKVELSRQSAAIEKQLGRKLEFEEDPYKKARVVQNSALARAEMLVSDDNPALVKSTLNKLYNGQIKHAVTIKDIFNGLDTLNYKYPEYLKNGNFKNWYEALSILLTAKHQLEIQNQKSGYKGPMSKADAENIIKTAPKELDALTEKFYQFGDNLLSIAQDCGLISKETVDALREKYKNYAPMSRDFSDEAAMEDAFATGKKIGNVSNPLKKLTDEGSTRSVIDPIESMVKNTYTLLSAAERNKVAQTFVKLSKESGIGEFVEAVPGGAGDAKKSVFTVMVDGKKEAFQTTPEFYRAIMSMNQQSANMLISIFKPFAQALRVGATISPDFMVRNLIRDTLTAGIYSETGFKPVLDSAKGVYSLIKDKELAYEFKASGAPLSAFVGLDRRNVNKMLNKMAGGSEWEKINPLKYIESGYEALREVSEYAESGTRIREFERARQQGKSIDEAGLFAKDVTLDFSRSGSLTKQINQVIPFFNAALQGGDRFVRALIQNPKRAVPFALMYITLPSIALWIANHDQDWYKELSDDIKNGSWVFNMNGTIIRVPKPFEPGIFFGSAIERALDKAYGQDPEAVKKWIGYAADGFTPNFIPTAAGPIIEWMTNYSFFTKKPVVGMKEQRLPDTYQFNDYTSEAAKRLGKFTGTSPEKIDNTISGYFGSAGKFFVGLLDNLVGNNKEMPAKTVGELPGVRGLAYTPFKNPVSVDEFYDKLEDAEKNHAATGKKGVVPPDLKKLRNAEQIIKDLQKDNRDMVGNQKLSADQKRQQIDANKAKILQIAKKALGKQ